MEYHIIILTILLSNYLLFAVNSSVVEEDTVKEPKYCQWGTTFVERSQHCKLRCSLSKGFIHPIHQKFLCTDDNNDLRGIPKLGESNDDELYDCECRHPFIIVFSCGQKVHHEKITYEQCNEICDNYVVLTFSRNNKREMYCEKASEIRLFELETLTLSALRRTENSDKVYYKPLCKCGVDIDVKAERKLMSIENRRKRGKEIPEPLAELTHSCLVGSSQLTSKPACKHKCHTAKAFVNTKSADFICYHERVQAVMVSSANEHCQCGSIVNKYRKNTAEKKMPCYPERKYPSYRFHECKRLCRSLYAYIFYSEPKRSVSYCDSRREPPEGIAGLEFRMSEMEKRVSARTNEEHLEFTCTCGISSLEQLENANTNETAGSFEVSANQGNISYSNEGASSFQVAINERNIRNFDGTSHFQAVGSLPAATNQISIRNSNRCGTSENAGKGKQASQSDHDSSFPPFFPTNEFMSAGDKYAPPQTCSRGTKISGFRSHRSREMTSEPRITYPYNKNQPVSNDDTGFGRFPTTSFNELTTSVPRPSTNQPDIYFTSNLNEVSSSSLALLSNNSIQNCGQKRNLDNFKLVQPGDEYDIPSTILQRENDRIGESSEEKSKFLLPDLNTPDKTGFIPDLNIPLQNSMDN